MGVSLQGLLKGRTPEILSGALSASIGAFVLTSPIVVFYFGVIRPIGLISSLVITPLCSIFMVFSMVALAASFLPMPIWNLMDLIMTALYRFLEFLVSIFARVPGIRFSTPYPVLVFTIVFWLLLFFVCRRDSLYRNRIASFD